MNLDFLNNLGNNLKENKIVQNFMKELGEYLEKNISTNLFSKEENGILTQIQDERNTSIISRNTMKNHMSEILKSYAQKTSEQGEMCFISSKKDDNYTVFKYTDNKENIIQLDKNELPERTGINSILRIVNGEYILDEVATKEVTNEITQMANSVLDKQDKQLEEFRREGHLYIVEEDRNDRIYLTDITDTTNNIVIEEVDFPKKLLNQASEGTVFQYKNGGYHFYSRDGFERISGKNS